MARNSSQSVFKTQSRDLVRQAGLVSYGVTLPDLYIDLILAGRMRFKEAARLYQQRLSDYGSNVKVVH